MSHPTRDKNSVAICTQTFTTVKKQNEQPLLKKKKKNVVSVLPITHFCPLHFTHSFCFSPIVVAWCDLWGWESFGGQGWLMGTRACMFFLVSLWPSTLFHVFVWLVIYMLWKFHWFLTTLFHAWLLMGFVYLSWFQWVFFFFVGLLG